MLGWIRRGGGGPSRPPAQCPRLPPPVSRGAEGAYALTLYPDYSAGAGQTRSRTQNMPGLRSKIRRFKIGSTI